MEGLWGSEATGELLRHADDFSLPRLRAVLRRAAGSGLRELHWASAVFPVPLRRVVAPIPLGDVLGMAAVLEGEPERTSPPLEA